ncbi:beta-phosphoglucomutase family hydrolase [Sinomonas atrocyanea]|uniref:beta-phosphoglucomutase family hydrolase n=1 Tax=Sinomonas atrocyanea TaxID=37927 RepID=UPI0028666CF3|nr:beta-phosphoglucomutase family hydrolase [Sinomonas atrocyanea]MDR6622702.1 beta-phosphoglucomutase family hydrolase [Sinomonas atrocyanea]
MRSPTVEAIQPPFSAVIFDLDGVVTDTAAVHEAAWRELFDAVLRDPRVGAGADTGPFRHEDYLEYVDGRPREEGVTAFLGARGIALPAGSGHDGPGAWTVHGLGARKNELFGRHLAASGVKVFPESARLVARLRAGRIPVALATSSRNARPVLAAAHLQDAFDLVLDGNEAAVLGLPGKPDPALFLEAARRLGVDPARAVVIEDAEAGVRAGRRGGFGLVVGIDRAGRRAELEDAGADLVLGDVGELDLGLVLADPWTLVYEGFDAGHEGHREALTTLGNGYIGVRGAAPESIHGGTGYPGTYLSGVYNRVVNLVQDQMTEDEHLVNAPNWLPVDLRLAGGEWWSRGGLTVRRERRVLDLGAAVLRREVDLEDDAGRRLRVEQRRFVSMAEQQLMALETTVTAHGWSGEAELRSGVNVDVANENVLEDALLARRHLRDVTPAGGDADAEAAAGVVIEAETLQSGVRIAVALRHTVDGRVPAESTGGRVGGLHYREFTLRLADGVPVRVAKTCAFATSRDRAISSPRTGAAAALERSAAGFDELAAAHTAVWERVLRLFTVGVEAAKDVQPVVNLHVFHLLQTLSPFVTELDVGVPARGLHGEGYRGHVFWDELFVLPLITSRIPAVARSLIAYRWRRLPAARHAAAEAGLEGALFPWQSGSDGREETPRWLFNRRSGHWIPDVSRLQRHVGLAVAFSAWQYFEATQDRFWLLRHGAELVVEVTRLFASLAEHDAAEDRFHLRGVMGPDEYHTGYPDRDAPGLDDNAYTNVMAAWTCQQACRILEVVEGHDREDLLARLAIGPEEVRRWERLSRRLAVPFHDDGIISQFAGYGDLAELDWDAYREKYHNIERLDLILEAEGDTTNRYRLAKQADTLMLLYLLGEEELLAVLARLGYTVTVAQLERAVDYYLARTAHGSTLSRVAHASVLAGVDPERAWETFREVLDADLDDTQGGTTQTGIHLGAMAGSIDVVQRSFAGLRLTGNALVFAPRLPREVRSVSFRVRYRDQLLEVHLTHAALEVASAPGDAAPVRLRANAEEALLHPGTSHRFSLAPLAEGPADA